MTKRCGFTLIELLVVVAILGILSTLVVANFNAARERGRDAQRKSDVRQVQNALRLYYNDHGVYPDNDPTNKILGCGPAGARTVCEWGQAWTTDEGETYMNKLPDDPVNGLSYLYDRLNLDSYELRACLENRSDESGQTSTLCSTAWEFLVSQ